jgi:predicted nucleotidyltransferase
MKENNRHMSKKIDIVSLSSGDYNRVYTGREIARILGINHQSAHTYLKGLSSLKVVNKKRVGRNTEYVLNLDNYRTKILLSMAEHDKALSLMTNNTLAVIIRELLEKVETIIVFGSYASGTAKTDSDLDLVIIGALNKNEIKRKLRLYALEINAEFISYTEFKAALWRKKPLALEILKNHVIFGDADRIIDMYWRWHKR